MKLKINESLNRLFENGNLKEDWIHDKWGNDVIESGPIVVPPIDEVRIAAKRSPQVPLYALVYEPSEEDRYREEYIQQSYETTDRALTKPYALLRHILRMCYAELDNNKGVYQHALNHILEVAPGATKEDVEKVKDTIMGDADLVRILKGIYGEIVKRRVQYNKWDTLAKDIRTLLTKNGFGGQGTDFFVDEEDEKKRVFARFYEGISKSDLQRVENLIKHKLGSDLFVTVDAMKDGDLVCDILVKSKNDSFRKPVNESLSDDRYEEIKSKTVQDSDGFWTDYTMYFDHNENKYVFVFGDKEMYSPEDGEFDWEEENPQAAEEWFDSYEGVVEDDLEESIEESTAETISPSPMYAYLVRNDMTDNVFALIHKDKDKVTNETGQRMFDQFITEGDEENFDEVVSELQKDGYYIGTDDDFPSPWVEITDWDWEEEENTDNWTAVINRQEIPLEIVNSSHGRF